jgi:rubrerythrin
MKYNEFKSIMWMQGIDSDIVEACHDFVVKENSWCLLRPGEKKVDTDSLGYAELSDLTTLEACIKDIKHSIWMSTTDYDALGRSREKVLFKRLKKDPGKHMKRVMLKAFYLVNGQP